MVVVVGVAVAVVVVVLVVVVDVVDVVVVEVVVVNQLPARASPFLSMTEATSMGEESNLPRFWQGCVEPQDGDETIWLPPINTRLSY